MAAYDEFESIPSLKTIFIPSQDPPAIRDKRIKIDGESWLEFVLRWGTRISVISLLITLILNLFPQIRASSGNPLFITLPAFIFFVVLFNNSRAYYILDLEKKALMFYYRILFFRRYALIKEFSEIAAVSVSGKHRLIVKKNDTEKNQQSRNYAVFLCCNDGTMIRLTDYGTAEFNELEKLAKIIGALAGIRQVPGKQTAFAKAIELPNAEHPKMNSFTFERVIIIVIAIVFSILILWILGFIRS